MITNFLKETLKEKWDEGRGLFLIPEKIQLFFFFLDLYLPIQYVGSETL